MIVRQFILKYQTIIYVTETSFEMASKLSQNWLPFFAKKLKISYILFLKILFKSHQYVAQILIKNVRRDFRLLVSVSVMITLNYHKNKCQLWKSILVVNLPLKLFTCYRFKCLYWKSGVAMHYLLYLYLDHMLAKCEPNHRVQNVQNFEFF